MSKRTKNNTRIKTKDGKILDIPNEIIKEINIPNVVIRDSYFKLKFDMEHFQESLKKIQKKFDL